MYLDAIISRAGMELQALTSEYCQNADGASATVWDGYATQDGGSSSVSGNPIRNYEELRNELAQNLAEKYARYGITPEDILSAAEGSGSSRSFGL